MNFRPIQDTQQVISNLQDEMNRMFERVWHVGVSTPPLDGRKWAPPVDVYEFDDRFLLIAEVPGIDAGSVEVSQLGNTLTLRGEKHKPAVASDAIGAVRIECRYGAFSRTVELPPGAAPEEASAKCQDGLLIVSVAKSQASRPRTVKVQSAGSPKSS